MKVRVTTSLAGKDFSFDHGQIVDFSVFASLVGRGADALCEPVEADEALPAPVDVIETTTLAPVVETAVKRRGRRPKGT